MKRFLTWVLSIAALLAGVSPARAQTPARDAGYLYLSPVPGAPYVAEQTRFVLLRFEHVTPAEVTNLTTSFITVTGAESGVHPGVTHVASDGRTVIFTMSADFNRNELVTVNLRPNLAPGTAGRADPYDFQFMVSAPMPGTLPQSALAGPPPAAAPLPAAEAEPAKPQTLAASSAGIHPLAAAIAPNGVSVPSDFPTVSISVNHNPSPGYLFLEPGVGLANRYTMILDNQGLPIWYRRGRMYDFKIQNNGLITWCSDPSSRGFPAFDLSFNYLRTYTTTNGYSTDGHDLKILEDGTYLMIGYRVDAVDMSLYVPGGDPDATFTETVVQEFTPSGELIFQWRAWDHYDIRLSGTDFPHLNGLDYDVDGHILVSARDLSEVTKINRDTGDIMWRLSGANNSFTFVNDPFNGTSMQHNITALGNGRYLVFDNGNGRSPDFSRAVEYELDLTNMTATLVWQFRDQPDKFTYWLGNAQRLATGNTLINFVRPQYPKVIEVDTNGVKHFELSLAPTSDTYRAFRLPWDGAVAVPYLVVEAQPDNVALVFNKFGDHTVDHYRIYGGTAPAPTTLLATSTVPLLHLTNVVNGTSNYFRVTAVSTNGVESGYSNEGSLLVNITVPGQNMVLNGDFSKGATGWTWQVTAPATAQWVVTNGLSHFVILSGGTYITDVQLKQVGIKLSQGKEYTFEFDAWSAAPRILEAKVEANAEGGINYSGLQPFTITPVTNHYTFHFTMASPSDNNARVVFNAGALARDVYLDNVSLREKVYDPGDFNLDGCVGLADLEVFAAQWQKKQGTLTADLNRDGKVDFADFVIFSKNWAGEGICP